MALPQAAAASSVRAYLPPCSRDCETVIAYTADPGERNDVGVQRMPRPAGADFTPIVVRDDGAPLIAAGECRSLDAHSAECDVRDDAPLAKGTFRLGDRVDYLDTRALPAPAEAKGGAGNDIITGSPHDDVLEGGPGHDSLHGRGGRDGAVFPERARGLRVDLASPALDGPPGSQDWLPNIEDVYAPRARGAVLHGGRGPNHLMAGPGGRVSGRGGDDLLTVGAGGRAFGGPGDDTISNDNALFPLDLPQRPPRHYGCGSGNDFVDGTGLGDLVRADCENVGADSASDAQWIRLFGHPRRGHAIAILSYSCLIEDGCPLTITGRIGSPSGPAVANRRLRLRFGGRDSRIHHYALRLNPRGRALLRRHGRLQVFLWFREGPYRTGARFTRRQGFATTARP
jgi:hypothetical protein